MSRDLKAIADRIGTTASQLLDQPQDVRLQAALLDDIQHVSLRHALAELLVALEHGRG